MCMCVLCHRGKVEITCRDKIQNRLKSDERKSNQKYYTVKKL